MDSTFDDQLSLNSAVQHNPIDAQWFLPFTIYRLQRYTSAKQLLLTVTLEQIHTEPVINRRLLLTWQENSPRLSLPPVQDTVITEWAACGIACAVLPFYTGLQVVKVTDLIIGWVTENKCMGWKLVGSYMDNWSSDDGQRLASY